MEAEAKAKVVASVWDRGKTASAARNCINSAPPNRRDDLCLCFCLHSSSMLERPDLVGTLYPELTNSSVHVELLVDICTF